MILRIYLLFAWIGLFLINNAKAAYPNCISTVPRVINGLLAYYALNDSLLNPTTLIARNGVSNTGSLSNLNLNDDSLWCTQSAGLCFETGRFASMGAFTTLFSPVTFGQLASSSGDFTLEAWFRQDTSSSVDTNGVLFALASWTNQVQLITPNNLQTCNIHQFYGYRDYFRVPTPLSTTQYLTSVISNISQSCEVFPVTLGSQSLHQLVIVVNHASANFITIYLDNQVVVTTSSAPRTLTNPMQLYLGPSNGATSRWNGDVHLVSMYQRALSQAEVTVNFQAPLPSNPVVALATTLNRFQGNPFITPFNITLYDFDVNVLGCSITLGLTVLTLPQKGYLLLQIANTPSWDVIGLVPFNVPNLALTPLGYLPFNPNGFGSPFDSFTYQGFNGGASPSAPAFPVVATGIINMVAVDHAPVPMNATFFPFAEQRTLIFMNATDPDKASTVPHTVVATFVVTLPQNGTLCGVTNVPGQCVTLTRNNIPWRVPTGSFVYYTSKNVLFNMTGKNPVFTDFFLFTATDGQLNSSISQPGVLSLQVQNPLTPIPTVNVTQEIRTQIASRVILQAEDINNPSSTQFTVLFQVVQLPQNGTLLLTNAQGQLEPITNASAVPLIPWSNSLPLFYQPFILTAGFNCDSFGFRIVNASNGFTSGVLFHFFFVNDPGVFITPNKTITVPVNVATSFHLFYVNGAQNAPVLTPSTVIPGYSSLQLPITFQIQVLSTFGTIQLAHPELFKNVTLQEGSLITPAVGVRFLTTRNVLNELISNVTVILTEPGTQTVQFQALDLNVDDGLFYLTTSHQAFTVTQSQTNNTPAATIPQWAIILFYVLGALLAILAIIGCVLAFQYGHRLNKTLSTETKMQKRQDKERVVQQKETAKLIKKDEKHNLKLEKDLKRAKKLKGSNSLSNPSR